MTDVTAAREEMTCWADWAGDLDRAAVPPEGRGLVEWTLNVVRDFYGDEWFARHAATRSLPVVSLADWPLSSPIAVVGLIERAARVALAPDDVRRSLADGPNGIRESNDVVLFRHLDVVLEVIGLALRDGYAVQAEVPANDGRLPDIRLGRGTLAYTVEVTTQGPDRDFRKADQQGSLLAYQQMRIETSFGVECSTKVHRQMDDAEFTDLVETLHAVASRTATTGTTTELDLGFAAAVAYPSDKRPEKFNAFEGPELKGDLVLPRL